MIEPCDEARQQMLLMAWFSPAFPIGSFAFSHALEWAQECGAVTDRAALEGWIGDLLAHGSARTDAILLAEGWRLAHAGDHAALREAADLAAALQPGRERYQEASVQGQAFCAMVRAAYPVDRLTDVMAGLVPAIHDFQQNDVTIVDARHKGGHDAGVARLTLPVSVGICGAAHRIDLRPLLTAYLAAFVANLSSAAVRLGIVGQTDGQRVIAALHPAVGALAEHAQGWSLDDLGSAALRSDLFSLQHETQYSRLFRS